MLEAIYKAYELKYICALREDQSEAISSFSQSRSVSLFSLLYICSRLFEFTINYMNQRRSPCDQSKLAAQVKEHLTLTRHAYVTALSLSTLSTLILSISTCSNTRVAPHLEVTAEKIGGDNCILSLHIILESQKVNFSRIFINHRRTQSTCHVPLLFLKLIFPLDLTCLQSYVKYNYMETQRL